MLEGLGLETPQFWDGHSYFNKIDNNESFGREFLILSQNAWSCQRTIRFNEWSLIKTFHTGLKDYPEIMLYDYENDFHMTSNVVDGKPDIIEKGLGLLNSWQKQMMEKSPYKIDPMETVLKEGGPFHTRGQLKTYLKRLIKTGREDMVKKIQDRKEPYTL